ncbi:MAG: hypothetical protein ACRD9R_20075 [Pyrinomonadaceae bacterium]
MIENLNLASEPFRNRALPWTVSAVVACASLLALVLIAGEGSRTRAQADAVERDLRGLRQERDAIKERDEQVRQTLTEEQRQTLEAAHSIVDRKKFSWSLLLANLEATLPQGVRVSRISVSNVERRGAATRGELELTVVGRTPAEITRMMAGMASTGVFSANLIREGTRTERGEAGTEATLRVFYAPGAGTISLPPVGRSEENTNVAASEATPEDVGTSPDASPKTVTTAGEARPRQR